MSPSETDEITINLRPLFETPLHWWRLILTFTIITSSFGMLNYVAVFSPNVYQATAGVAIVKSRTEVKFDASAVTVTDEEMKQVMDSTNKAAVEESASARRNTLVGLVNNGAIADRVREQVLDYLTEDEQKPGWLSGVVQATLLEVKGSEGASDLIQIQVENKDAELATLIANAWATEYERLVNDVYARPPLVSESLLGDLDEAQKTYEQAQNDLTNFQKDNQIPQLEREIEANHKLLVTLSDAQNQILSTSIADNFEIKMGMYRSFNNAAVKNRLLAFESEQARKHGLMQAYLDTQTNATVNLFQLQAQERLRILTDAYDALARNERLLRNAVSLRDQASSGGDARSTSLAIAFLKAEVAGTSGPANLDLYFQDATAFAPADVVADTEALVQALESQKRDIEKTIAEQRELLIAGKGIDITEPITDTALTELIYAQYPKLFEMGEWGELSLNVPEDTQLVQLSQKIANEIIQFEGLQELLNYTVQDTPLNRKVGDLEQTVRDLQSKIEQEKSQLQMLSEKRDLAYDIYSTLSRKVAEYKVTEQLPGTEVRFAATASVPSKPISKKRNQILFIILTFIGMFVGIVGAFYMEFIAPLPYATRLFGAENAVWNRLFRWVIRRSALRIREYGDIT